MNIVVVGCGYVGLVNAAYFADCGHFVTCVDSDAEKIDKLIETYTAPFYERALNSLLQRNKRNLIFTTRASDAYTTADVICICLPTEALHQGVTDTAGVYNIGIDIAESISHDAVVILKSTVPVGTSATLNALLACSKHQLTLLYMPEFLSQGNAVFDVYHPARIVIGANEISDADYVNELLALRTCPIHRVAFNEAELIKEASNGFLALKISYINEIASLCERMDASIDKVADAVGDDPRIGKAFLKAGVGYGGSCLAKDTKGLIAVGASVGCDMAVLKAGLNRNLEQRRWFQNAVRKYKGSLFGKTVTVLGLAFKRDTDDLRESVALDLIEWLISQDCTVKAWDSYAMLKCFKLFPTVNYCDTIESALEESHICFVCSDDPQISTTSLTVFAQVGNLTIFDGRNLFSPTAMAQQGIQYISVGRPVISIE